MMGAVQKCDFSLAWLAEELLHRNKFIILHLFRTEDLVEESTGAGGLSRNAAVSKVGL